MPNIRTINKQTNPMPNIRTTNRQTTLVTEPPPKQTDKPTGKHNYQNQIHKPNDKQTFRIGLNIRKPFITGPKQKIFLFSLNIYKFRANHKFKCFSHREYPKMNPFTLVIWSQYFVLIFFSFFC